MQSVLVLPLYLDVRPRQNEMYHKVEFIASYRYYSGKKKSETLFWCRSQAPGNKHSVFPNERYCHPPSWFKQYCRQRNEFLCLPIAQNISRTTDNSPKIRYLVAHPRRNDMWHRIIFISNTIEKNLKRPLHFPILSTTQAPSNKPISLYERYSLDVLLACVGNILYKRATSSACQWYKTILAPMDNSRMTVSTILRSEPIHNVYSYTHINQ